MFRLYFTVNVLKKKKKKADLKYRPHKLAVDIGHQLTKLKKLASVLEKPMLVDL